MLKVQSVAFLTAFQKHSYYLTGWRGVGMLLGGRESLGRSQSAGRPVASQLWPWDSLAFHFMLGR